MAAKFTSKEKSQLAAQVISVITARFEKPSSKEIREILKFTTNAIRIWERQRLA